MDEQEARQCLHAYYAFYAPEKLGQIDDVLFAYHGRYDEMATTLATKYGARPCIAPGLLARPAPNQLTPADARKRLVALYLEYAPLEVSSVDALLLGYEGRLEEAIRRVVARLGPEPDIAARRERLVRFYEYYQPEKLKHIDDILFAYSGDMEALFAGLRDKYGPEPDTSDASPHDTTRRRLTAFFAKYAPARIAAVDDILLVAGPRHQELFHALQQRYGPEPSATSRQRSAAVFFGGAGSGVSPLAPVTDASGAPLNNNKPTASMPPPLLPSQRPSRDHDDGLMRFESNDSDNQDLFDDDDDSSHMSFDDDRGGRETAADAENFPYRSYLARVGVSIRRELEHELGPVLAPVVALVAWCRQTSSLSDMTVDDIQLPKRPTALDRAAFRYLQAIDEVVNDESAAREALSIFASDAQRSAYVDFRRTLVVLAVAQALQFTLQAEPRLRSEVQSEEALDRELLYKMRSHHSVRISTRHDPTRVDSLWTAFVRSIEASGSALPGMRPTNKHPELYHKTNHKAVVVKEAARKRAVAVPLGTRRRSKSPTATSTPRQRQPSITPSPPQPVVPSSALVPGPAARVEFCSGDLGSDAGSSSPSEHRSATPSARGSPSPLRGAATTAAAAPVPSKQREESSAASPAPWSPSPRRYGTDSAAGREKAKAATAERQQRLVCSPGAFSEIKRSTPMRPSKLW